MNAEDKRFAVVPTTGKACGFPPSAASTAKVVCFGALGCKQTGTTSGGGSGGRLLPTPPTANATAATKFIARGPGSSRCWTGWSLS
ncbi:hypothetical protein [Methylomagnum sp.]